MNTRLWKFALIFLALTLLVVLFLWPSENDERVDISVSVPTVEKQLEGTSLTDVGTTTMKSPKFIGEDSQQRRWEVKAKEATQSGALNPDHVWLNEIEAKAEDADGRLITFKAGEGSYKKEGSTLQLDEGVKVEGYGFTLETESLESNLKKRTVTGDSSVVIQNENGILKAGQFELENNGDVIRLHKGVHGRFLSQETMNQKQEEK